MPEEVFVEPKPKNWPKIILAAVLGLGLLAGAAYAGYWYGVQQVQLIRELPQPIMGGDGASVLYIYKRYEQRSLEMVKAFKVSLGNYEKTELKIDSDVGVKFSSAKDGENSFEVVGSTLEIPSSELTNLLRKVTKGLGENERVSSTVWSSDESIMAYVVTEQLEPNKPYGTVENSVHLINRDGSGQRFVKRFREPQYIHLVGLNLAKEELYWFGVGGTGTVIKFTTVSLANGAIKEVKDDLGSGIPYYAVRFSSDLSMAYYIKGGVIEYNLVNDNRRVLYELDKVGSDARGNKSFLDRLLLSPKENLLVFTQVDEPSDKEITYSITLPDGQVSVLLDKPCCYNIGPFYWSPDGKYIWFETFCHGCGDESGFNNEGEYYIMDMDTREVELLFKGAVDEYEEDVRIDETIEFVGWLNE